MDHNRKIGILPLARFKGVGRQQQQQEVVLADSLNQLNKYTGGFGCITLQI